MGGKKGGSSHTPVEAKETGRSYQIARILEVISEGEIYGLVDDMSSVYLDKTPLQNQDGSFNFKNVSVYANAGTQSQDVIREFNSVEREVNVGTKVKKDKPLIKTVSDTEVTRLRMTLGVERLMRTQDNGDINPTSVVLRVSLLKNNLIYSTRDYTFNGKYSNPYREMFYIDALPQAPFQIKVERLTDDSNTTKLANDTFWGSYTEIIDEQFAYPNTALVGIKLDSEYFNNIPTRNYEIYGLIVKVPSNYDAWQHRYTSDFWDGEFKLSWTNNPAWIFYDLVTNTRYGMGSRLSDFGIDKWQLYAIGRYCDETVPDGYGGTEPRMTCNVWLTDQRKAYDLIHDLCSVFRAMPVWNGQALTAIQDRASDPVWTYTNANTIDGFKRQRSARKARHNTIHVEYIDKNDFYEKKVECVTDDKLVARFGLNIKKVTAFGCTSRGQAYRTGRWLLETEKLETETITFTVGQEGVMHLPYDIIEVADNNFAGVNIGGRILSVNGTNVQLDREIEIDDKSYLSFVSGKGKTENVKIVSYNNATKTVTLAKNITGTPEYSIWALTTKRVTTGLYRAISIKENDKQGGKTYTITAIQHVPEKEDIVTNGTHFEPRPQSIYSEVTSAELSYDGTKYTLSGKVSGTSDALRSKPVTSYTVKLTRDGVLVYIEKGLKTPDIKLDDLENGNYEAVISSYNEHGQLLGSYSKTFVIDRPPLVTSIELNGHFSAIWLRWAYVNEYTQTEIWCSETDDINTAKLLATVNATSYSHELGVKKTRYYWLRHKRGINLGLFDQVQGRMAKTNNVDLDKELKQLNKELSKNIVDEIIDVALPARKLDMVLTVANIADPTVYLNHKQLYNEADGKLWVWNTIKNKYEPDSTEVLASAIKGIIQPNQLATIPTSKLGGQLTDAQIQSINATKLIGNISIDRIPSIPTSKLTGVLSSNQIAELDALKLRGTIAVDRIPTLPTAKLVGNIEANRINGTLPIAQLPSIPTSKLTGQITSNQLASVEANKISGTINPNQLASIPTSKLTGTVTASQIGANSIGANAIQAGVIGATHLGANSVTASAIQVNAIATEHLQARAIKASKMALYGENMILDPLFEDKSYWQENMMTSNDCVWNNGKITITLNNTPTLRSYDTYIRGLRNRLNFPIDKGRSYRLQCRIKVTGANSQVFTGVYLTAFPDTTSQDSQANGVNRYIVVGERPDKAGNRNDLVTLIVRPEDFATMANAKWFGVYLRVGSVNAGQSATGVVEFSEIELIKMADSELIVDGAISAQKVQANAITTDKIQASAITGDKLAVNSVSTDKLQANSIDSSKIKALAIDASKIATNAITAEKILANSITSVKIATNAITSDKINANSVTADKVATNAIIARHIATDAIESNKIKANSITAVKIASGAIVSDKIATNAITATHIQANAIDATKIRANSIGTNALQANAVSADKIQSNAITSAKIQAGAINANHLQAGSISTDKLAVGLGGNLFYNPIFANDGDGWTVGAVSTEMEKNGYGFNSNTGDYQGHAYLDGEQQFRWQRNRKQNNNTNRFGYIYQDVKLVKDRYYCFSAYVGGHRSTIKLGIEGKNGGSYQVIRQSWTGNGATGGYGAGSTKDSGIEESRRIWLIFKVNGNVDSFYRAIINFYGVNGEIEPFVAVRRPMLEDCTAHITQPSVWQNAGVTSIHGGSIKANTITAREIKGGTITANEIASKTISADKISINTLSALTANLGYITAGSVRIGSLNGGIGTLFEITADGKLSLTARNATGGIELSSEKQALIIYEGTNEVVRIGKL